MDKKTIALYGLVALMMLAWIGLSFVLLHFDHATR